MASVSNTPLPHVLGASLSHMGMKELELEPPDERLALEDVAAADEPTSADEATWPTELAAAEDEAVAEEPAP
jgi:hypothetical protein